MAGAKPVAADERAPVSAGKVLVVDDDRDIARAVALRLAAAGFTPIVAFGGGDALRRARSDAPAAIVLDLRMPGIDGYAVLRDLPVVQEGARIPRIVLSAAPAGQAMSGALSGGAAYFLEKPYRPRDLIAAVKAAIAAASFSSSPLRTERAP